MRATHTVTIRVSSASGSNATMPWCHVVTPMLECTRSDSSATASCDGFMRACCTGFDAISGPMTDSTTSRMAGCRSRSNTAGPQFIT